MILKNKKAFVLVAIFTALPLAFAHAAPNISSPYVHQGEVALELKSEYKIDDGEDKDDAWSIETSLSYGVTSFWEAEISLETEDEGHAEDAEFSKVVFENKFQLAEPGEYFVDPGLKVEYAHNLEGGPDEIEAKLLFAKKTEMFSHGLNLKTGREIGEDSDNDWEFGLSYGLTYEYSDDIQFGVEWYSSFGDFEDDFDEQEHKVGPVLFAEPLEGVGFETGVLFGVTDATPDATLKAIIEFEF